MLVFLCLAIVSLGKPVKNSLGKLNQTEPKNSFVEVFKRAAEPDFCWKRSYGRGVGTIPSECGKDDKNGALCYPSCGEGYKGVGPVCWRTCDEGFHDDGAFCRRTKHLKIYAKKSHGRGAGKLMSCSSDKENNAGLCYNRCKNHFKGIGPVCWGECHGKLSHDCAAGCATSKGVCAKVILEQVTSVVQFAVNLACIAATLGGYEVGLTLAKLPIVLTKIESASAVEAVTMRLMSAGKQLATGEAIKIATDLVKHGAEGTQMSLLELEPTGIGSIVYAFHKPNCEDVLDEPKVVIAKSTAPRVNSSEAAVKVINSATTTISTSRTKTSTPSISFPTAVKVLIPLKNIAAMAS